MHLYYVETLAPTPAHVCLSMSDSLRDFHLRPKRKVLHCWASYLFQFVGVQMYFYRQFLAPMLMLIVPILNMMTMMMTMRGGGSTVRHHISWALSGFISLFRGDFIPPLSTGPRYPARNSQFIALWKEAPGHQTSYLMRYLYTNCYTFIFTNCSV